jgi:hypothetical protein
VFTKAIVLAETEFGALISDFVSMFMDDHKEEMRSGKITEEYVRSYFVDCFRELLNSQGVHEMVILIRKGNEYEVERIWSGHDFVDYVLEYLKTESLLDYIYDWWGIFLDEISKRN